MNPIRLQLSRRRGFNLQKLSRDTNGLPAVNCARPSKFGNPHKVEDAMRNLHCDKAEAVRACVRAFADWTKDKHASDFVKLVKKELRGKNLACFCRADSPCHVNVLLKIANS